MKQRIKYTNNREKGLLGTLIAAGIGALASIGTSIYNNKQQQKRIEEQNAREDRNQLLATNQANALQAAANQGQIANYEQQNEIEALKTGTINSLSSQSSQFKCGGKKRMKKAGGTITTDLNKIKLYI